MTARWDDLPKTARPAKSKRRPVRRHTFRCAGITGCGELLVDVTYAAAERHADVHGGARIECVAPTRKDSK